MKIQGCIVSILTLGILALGTGCNSSPDPTPSTDHAVKSISGASSITSPPVIEPSTGGTPLGATPTPVSTPTGTVPSLVSALGIKPSVDLRANDGPIMTQFGGTCSDFATAGVMNNMLKAKGINKLVSERDLWSHYGVYDMDAAVTAASNNYITEEQYWPVNGSPSSDYESHATLRITQTIPHEYNMEAALQGLSQGHATVMAIQVPSGIANCDTMVSPTSAATSGQHVMAAVGYQLDDSVSGGGYFILKGSWGVDCGEKGYQYFPFALCKRSDLYCYFTEVVDVEDKSK